MGDGGVRLETVTVRYPARRTPALENVDVRVSPGERIGIAGRTGAGKSTLALTSAGFIPRVVRARVEGAITIDGVSPLAAAASELLGRVGIVFSTPANQLSGSKLTVREELAFGLENLGMPRDEMDARLEAVMARLRIEHLAGREPFALSGGEQQRVAIASIVAMGTRVLILDEPTAQLDPAGTADITALLGELATDGVTVMCVEHDPTLLGQMDRVMVLDQGRVVANALPGEALSDRSIEPLGLAAPALVRLADAAGIPARRAFDEDAIVEAFRDRRTEHTGATPRVVGAQPAIAAGAAWRPARERPVPDLVVERLVHDYPGGVEAVRGIDFGVKPGELVAIVGQNGSGKTTLVKHFNGLLRPASGRILIGGRDTVAEPIHALAALVGFVFQNPDDQLFERSVEREIAFGPRSLGIPPTEVRLLVDQAIEATGLDEVRTSNPYDLDLSRRKLVGLASVLATDPAIVVLDEPTTGQDHAGVVRVGGIVASLKAAGRTVIAITHDMEFAARHFERVVVMRLGEIVADGTPAEVFRAANAELLASTGLTPPPAARIAARLGLDAVPADADELLRILAGRPSPGRA